MLKQLLKPFEYVALRHPELRVSWLASGLAGFVWLLADLSHFVLIGRTVSFFHPGGVLDGIVGMLSVMVGIYFGLAGVVATSTNDWLQSVMPGGIQRPNSASPMTRSEFFMTLLIYCSASSMTIVFAAALFGPMCVALIDSVGTALPGLRVAVSLISSSAVLVICFHLFLSSILSFRFLSRVAP